MEEYYYDENLNEAYIGEKVVEFDLKTYEANGEFGTFSLKNNMKKGKWTVLLFYPADFTFVCPTELKAFSTQQDEFDKLDTTVIGVSTDKVWSHKNWAEGSLGKLNFPLAEDPTGSLSKFFRIYNYEEGLAWRGLFIIGPDGKLYSQNINFGEAGRSVTEAIRNLKAVQEAFDGKLVPCDWKPGQDFLTKD